MLHDFIWWQLIVIGILVGFGFEIGRDLAAHLLQLIRHPRRAASSQ